MIDSATFIPDEGPAMPDELACLESIGSTARIAVKAYCHDDSDAVRLTYVRMIRDLIDAAPAAYPHRFGFVRIAAQAARLPLAIHYRRFNRRWEKQHQHDPVRHMADIRVPWPCNRCGEYRRPIMSNGKVLDCQCSTGADEDGTP